MRPVGVLDVIEEERYYGRVDQFWQSRDQWARRVDPPDRRWSFGVSQGHQRHRSHEAAFYRMLLLAYIDPRKLSIGPTDTRARIA